MNPHTATPLAPPSVPPRAASAGTPQQPSHLGGLIFWRHGARGGHHRQSCSGASLSSGTDESIELDGRVTRLRGRSGITNGQISGAVVENVEGRMGNGRVRRKDGVVRRFWKRYVTVDVPVETRRDHLALERTFLGYLRTSLALSMLGVLTAQLFFLSDPSFQASTSIDELNLSAVPARRRKAGVALAAAFVLAAICTVCLGGVRFWRLQARLQHGKVVAGGWEVFGVGALFVAVVAASLAVVVVAGS